MTLTVPALGIEDAPVFSSDSEDVLDEGVMHVPETSMPWDGGEQTNGYLAGHRLGWPGTLGRLIFYHLDKLKRGDVIAVEGQGETYRCRVAEKFVVEPDDRWVMGQVIDRHMLTLQTCTLPALRERIPNRSAR